VGLGIGLDRCGENLLPPPGYETRTVQAHSEISYSSCELINSVALEGLGLHCPGTII
jgi:hypothetical protein